jgi:hypothetical protein
MKRSPQSRYIERVQMNMSNLTQQGDSFGDVNSAIYLSEARAALQALIDLLPPGVRAEADSQVRPLRPFR